MTYLKKTICATSLGAILCGDMSSSNADSLYQKIYNPIQNPNCESAKLGAPPSNTNSLRSWLQNLFSVNSHFIGYSIASSDDPALKEYLEKVTDAVGWKSESLSINGNSNKVLGAIEPVGSWFQSLDVETFSKGMATGMEKSCSKIGGKSDSSYSDSEHTPLGKIFPYSYAIEKVHCSLGDKAISEMAFIFKGRGSNSGYALTILAADDNLADKALENFQSALQLIFDPMSTSALCSSFH